MTETQGYLLAAAILVAPTAWVLLNYAVERLIEKIAGRPWGY